MKREKSRELHLKIASYIRSHPRETYEQISAMFGMSLPMVGKIAEKHGISRRAGKMPYDPEAAFAKLKALEEK
jgi:hypothetical protein